jgi:hypothetical protein
MKIDLCKGCNGHGTVFEPQDPDWVYRRGHKTHTDYTKTCPQCLGHRVIPWLDSNCTGAILEAEFETILGRFTAEYRIQDKPGTPGFDLWVNGKKLTRGPKYLRAKSLNQAIANILIGSDYKEYVKAEVTPK